MNWKRYFLRKSIEELVEKASSCTRLKRSMGPVQLVLLGMGAIIGAGIFVFIGQSASSAAGPAIVLSFGLAGAAAACAGLCYAELSSMIPVSGSAYTYVSATLGECAGWLVGSMWLVGALLITSSVACGWSGYAMSLLADFGIHFDPAWTNTTGTLVSLPDGLKTGAFICLPAVLICIFIAWILCFGIETSSIINALVVAIKMFVLGTFVVVGIPKIDVNNWIPFIPANTGEYGKFGISGVIGGAAMIFSAYNGFDTVSTAAQETKNPQKNLPIGIIGSIIVCTITYILIAAVLTGIVKYTELNTAEPLALAVDRMGLPWFSTLLKFGAVAGLTSVMLAMIYGIVRVTFTITQDGLLPSALGKCHPKHQTPFVITILASGLVAIAAGTVKLNSLIQLASFCLMFVFAIVCFTCIVSRYTQPNLKRVFLCPWMPFIPICGILLFIQIMYPLFLDAYKQVGILVICSLTFYMVYGQRHSLLQKSSLLTMQ